jgi:hypothetical protein
MKIEKIVYRGADIHYTRKYDAVFVEFPDEIKKGTAEEIQIVYSGAPQLPDISSLSGGFIWTQDKNGNPWIETVVQGSGASLWWPCKDHLSDKPDSMRISVTVPAGLTAFQMADCGKTDLPDSLARLTGQWVINE